jgi:hypothetical protein
LKAKHFREGDQVIAVVMEALDRIPLQMFQNVMDDYQD